MWFVGEARAARSWIGDLGSYTCTTDPRPLSGPTLPPPTVPKGTECPVLPSTVECHARPPCTPHPIYRGLPCPCPVPAVGLIIFEPTTHKCDTRTSRSPIHGHLLVGRSKTARPPSLRGLRLREDADGDRHIPRGGLGEQKGNTWLATDTATDAKRTDTRRSSSRRDARPQAEADRAGRTGTGSGHLPQGPM